VSTQRKVAETQSRKEETESIYPCSEIGCRIRKLMNFRKFSPKNIMTSQVIGFSPVRNISHLFMGVFTPFLSHKELVSRRLRKKRGLFKFAKTEVIHLFASAPLPVWKDRPCVEPDL
jgi:hypothetical protein